jgi:hypothetical protein
MSAVGQNQPLKVEIKGFQNQPLFGTENSLVTARIRDQWSNVEHPKSKPANHYLQFKRPRLGPKAHRTRAWDRSRDRRPAFAVSKTKHFNRGVAVTLSWVICIFLPKGMIKCAVGRPHCWRRSTFAQRPPFPLMTAIDTLRAMNRSNFLRKHWKPSTSSRRPMRIASFMNLRYFKHSKSG